MDVSIPATPLRFPRRPCERVYTGHRRSSSGERSSMLRILEVNGTTIEVVF